MNWIVVGAQAVNLDTVRHIDFNHVAFESQDARRGIRVYWEYVNDFGENDFLDFYDEDAAEFERQFYEATGRQPSK